MEPIKSGKFILTDLVVNNNKFWNIDLFADGTVTTTWGRVGKVSQSKTFSHAGESFFNSKIREKTAKGYTEQATISNTATQVVASTGSLVDIARKELATSKSPLLDDLVARLAKTNVHQILASTQLKYNTSSGMFSTPLGLVTPEGIADARVILNDIGRLVVSQDWESTIPHLNKYLRLIPQDIGMKRLDPRNFLPDIQAVAAQNGILDSLEASLQMATAQDSSDPAPVSATFNVELDIIQDSKQIEQVRRLYKSTLNSIHAAARLDVKNVYSVKIKAMHDNFESKGRVIGGIQRLWHGTRVGNVLSILKNGFIIPPSNASYCTGRLFGNGVYFAIQSTKSLNYAYGTAPGQRGGLANDNCFMFLADVALGRHYVPRYGENSPPKGYDSLWAKPGQSGIMNDEIIIYNTAQCNPVLLVEFGR